MRTVSVALLLTLTLLVVPAAAGARGDDAPAIAKFLSIGFTNASTNFTAIRGHLTQSNELGETYDLTQWPDRTHFGSCRTSHDVADTVMDEAARYSYACVSTPRTISSSSLKLMSLFKMAERAVQANLPSGYASTGVKYSDLRWPYEVWKKTGSPRLELDAYPVAGGTDKGEYSLLIEVFP